MYEDELGGDRIIVALIDGDALSCSANMGAVGCSLGEFVNDTARPEGSPVGVSSRRSRRDFFLDEECLFLDPTSGVGVAFEFAFTGEMDGVEDTAPCPNASSTACRDVPPRSTICSSW